MLEPENKHNDTPVPETGETGPDDEPQVTAGAIAPDRSGLSAADIEALTYGLPSAEHVLEILCEADSRSEQLQVIQTAWSAADRSVSEESAAGVLGRLNKADSREMQLRVLRHAAARLATYATLDAAARPIFVPGAQFRHTAKLVQRASASGLEPQAFADLLDTLVDEIGGFLSAAQAQELVETISAPAERQFRFWHVACSRVFDRWNVTESSHAAGACDYGWDATYTLTLAAACGKQPPVVTLQSKVLSRMGRGDPEVALSSRIPEFAARTVATITGAASSTSNAAEID